MQDYRHTLNLPTTDFPMKANLAQREPAILAQWQTKRIYEQLRQLRQGRAKFILHDGPPYANGPIHVGHALNKILKDIVVKANSLSGLDAPFVPGWDCHGLPIELNVEKKYGKVSDKLSAKDFRDQCRAYAQSQLELQRKAFERLGVFGDWQHPYTTMDFAYEANIIRALAKVLQNDHLQRGYKPVHWCMDCQTALAEAEVEYADKSSPAIDVRFVVKNPERFPGHGQVSIPIWTTTPWTLPANEAVTLHPQHEYVLLQTAHERLLVIAPLAESAMTRYGMTDYQVIATYQQAQLENLVLQHPFYDKTVPVIFGEHVTFDTGTGAVHTAPAHGLEDYQMGVVWQLPANNPVNEKGCFYSEIPFFGGQFVFKANAAIIEMLQQKNNLLAQQTLMHSYPHCWRHKTPIIFRATPQWFICMDKNHLRRQALAAISKIQWIPAAGEARLSRMIENRPDWCISRQRYWNVPMAFIVHKKTGELHPQMPVLMEEIAKIIDKQGINAWHDLSLDKLLPADEIESYQKTTDTVDVWFDSGVSHFAVLHQRPELSFPADLYLEGSDQHRGWFHSSLLTSIAMYGVAPYKAVLTHGFTVDEKGHKMSKSLGNTIEPEKIVNSLGADILRLWVSATDFQGEVVLSEEILQRIAEAYRRIRNTMRFLLANLHDFTLANCLGDTAQLLSLDKWLLHRAHQLQAEIQQAYAEYNFHLVYQKLHHFCSVELGGFYLDVIKDRQYTMQPNSIGRRSAQTAIYHLLQAMVRWIAPILSFTAEEIWSYVLQPQAGDSVFLTEWYVLPEVKADGIDWEKILLVREEVNKALEAERKAGVIGAALEAAVTIIAPTSYYEALSALGEELRFVLITSQASVVKGEELKITVNSLQDPKCARCWHRRADVGQQATHPTLCHRCVSNLPDAEGEVRHYA